MSAPLPPPDPPVAQLKRYHTSPELREELTVANLATTGTKSDLCLRLVKHKSGHLTEQEVSNEFTVAQLRQRLGAHRVPFSSSDKKAELVAKYMKFVI